MSYIQTSNLNFKYCVKPCAPAVTGYGKSLISYLHFKLCCHKRRKTFLLIPQASHGTAYIQHRHFHSLLYQLKLEMGPLLLYASIYMGSNSLKMVNSQWKLGTDWHYFHVMDRPACLLNALIFRCYFCDFTLQEIKGCHISA